MPTANPTPAIAINHVQTRLLWAYVLVNLLTFALRYHQYSDTSSLIWVPLARASAACIYLNFGLLLLPMLRMTLSWRRFDALRQILPLSKAMAAHMLVGNAIVLFSAIHVGAYAAIYLAANLRLEQIAFAVPVSGLALTVLIVLLAAGAWLRTRLPFEVFFYSHFLAVPVFVLCIIHTRLFLAVMLVPAIAYLMDRLFRLLWSTQAAKIEHIAVQGRDISLVIHRPAQFTYQAGDFAFLCVPGLSRMQWHPFSLINSPDAGGSLAFRIRRCGNWTEKLGGLPIGTRVLVDGPFASPCRDLHECRSAIIVAAGIGITPFASFLAEIESNYKGTGELLAFERLHLYWFERDQASQAGFYPLIERLERSLGGALTANLIVAAQAQEPLKRLVSVRTVQWDEEFGRLREQWLGATVFFCGPKPLSNIVRASSERAGFAFVTESF